MRIPSASTDRKIYFVAVDATDLKTRETALASFTVVRSRDGGADATYTTPTIAEIDAVTMPGVYALTIDEDTTIGASHDTEEYCVHITHAGMAPVTRTIELYRVKFTEGQAATMANNAVDADLERLQGSAIATPTVAGVLEVDVTHWIGTAAATPTTAGVPEVDVTHWLGVAPLALVSQRVVADVGAISGDNVAADNAEAFFDGTGYAGTNNVIPTVTTLTNAVTANVTQISGSTPAADNAETLFAGLTAIALTNLTTFWDNDGGPSGLLLDGTDVNAFLTIHNLDHIAGNAAGIPAVPAGTYLDQIMDDGTASYDRTTDSLQASRDNAATLNWAAGSRTLTAGTNIVLAKGVGVTGFNDISAANVNTEVLDVVATDTLIDGKTIQAALRIIAAAVAGRVSGAGTGTETFLGLDEATSRIVITCDASGNRSDIVYS